MDLFLAALLIALDNKQTIYVIYYCLVGLLTLKSGSNVQDIAIHVGDHAGLKVNSVLTELTEEFVFE